MHVNLLTGIRDLVAQQNESKPNKPYGHKIAELTFSGMDSKGKLKHEYTYVDPYNENVPLWSEVIETFVHNRPCNIMIEYPNGVKFKNSKTGLINADIEDTKPKILDIIDPKTGLSKQKKKQPKDLFDFG